MGTVPHHRVRSPMTTKADALPTFALHHGDALTALRALPSRSVDLLITDPAYESLEKHRASPPVA
jgi:hypothetical protein